VARIGNASQGRVLVVDQAPLERQALVRELQRAKFDVLEANGYDEALAALDGGSDIIAVVSDCHMQGRSGLELLAEVQRRAPSTFRILYSGSLVERQVQAATRGRVVDAFFSKPWAAGEIAAAIRGVRRLIDG